ncbi:hypothetical protein EUTSA_v10001747mg [Eutrema salsugineum]|uniref:Uncharacterized protein n=1 Tax=Eutrema salsugineum TaxID=72664 RepID=V4LHL5_EUTSA|nr:hypothetical protein EUTSA_v10001747mg [Eutrema salsugineum]
MTNARLPVSCNSQVTVTEKISGGRDHKIWDCESPLYDSYELVSFAHIIERKLLPFPPLTRPSGMSLRALMDKDKDDYSSASKTTTCSIHRRKYWWNRKKNEKIKETFKKKKLSDCILWWDSYYKKLFV